MRGGGVKRKGEGGRETGEKSGLGGGSGGGLCLRRRCGGGLTPTSGRKWKEDCVRMNLAAAQGSFQRDSVVRRVGCVWQLKTWFVSWVRVPQSGHRSSSAPPIRNWNDFNRAQKPERSCDKVVLTRRGSVASLLSTGGGRLFNTRLPPRRSTVLATTSVWIALWTRGKSPASTLPLAFR